MSRATCRRCKEQFPAGASGRLVCGICWPAHPWPDYAAVPVSAERRRALAEHAFEATEAEAEGRSVS